MKQETVYVIKNNNITLGTLILKRLFELDYRWRNSNTQKLEKEDSDWFFIRISKKKVSMTNGTCPLSGKYISYKEISFADLYSKKLL